ncbi:MAG: hypothetical protein WC325_10215 [Candidatus Bathyarchaeia archaeon]
MTEYTSISLTTKTKERLESHKLTRGEYWDDVVNRLLNIIEHVEAQ